MILPDIIHEDQLGFILGRYSVVNVRKVLTFMQWLEMTKPPGHHAMVSLDAEKAFDLVAWNHLFDSLNRLGAPDGFILVLRRFYAGSSSQILSNGHLSSPFLILQGTHQGCPLSPLLFAVALEPLLLCIIPLLFMAYR